MVNWKLNSNLLSSRTTKRDVTNSFKKPLQNFKSVVSPFLWTTLYFVTELQISCTCDYFIEMCTESLKFYKPTPKRRYGLICKKVSGCTVRRTGYKRKWVMVFWNVILLVVLSSLQFKHEKLKYSKFDYLYLLFLTN